MCDNQQDSVVNQGSKTELSADGTFSVDGERWGTLSTLSKILEVSIHAIKPCVDSGQIPSRTAKAHDGKLVACYSESEVRKACKHLLPRPSPES